MQRAATAEDDFARKVEVRKETSKFRELATDGRYAEADMKKPVSEGGLGLKEILGFIASQRTQYPLSQEYTLNNRGLNIII